MKTKTKLPLPEFALSAFIFALLGVGAPRVHAAPTYWTGALTFVHPSGSAGTVVDKLTTNHVAADAVNNLWLTRGFNQPLYNAAGEGGWNGSTSPVNTMWALASGPLTNAASLTYGFYYSVVGHPQGQSPAGSVGKTYYVHILSDDIYFSLTVNAWGISSGGGFTYTRTTPAVLPPPTPTVHISSPANFSVFSAPASVGLTATASVTGGGTVTNVEFFVGASSLGSVTTAPFSLTVSNLAAAPYALTAVATAAGISATSSVVHITVVSPIDVSLVSPQVSSNQFSFNYTANSGLRYVVQSSSNLLNWLSLVTNTAASDPVNFTDNFNATSNRYYRVVRLPNP